VAPFSSLGAGGFGDVVRQVLVRVAGGVVCRRGWEWILERAVNADSPFGVSIAPRQHRLVSSGRTATLESSDSGE